jgi:predicted metal-dependent hydrolase
LPAELSDYIIVHELCHLGQLNHSRDFWDLVARTTPNYLALRAELKKKGMEV